MYHRPSSSFRIATLAAAVAAACGEAPFARAQDRPPILEGPSIEVVESMPLPGLGSPIREVPANVQVQTADDIRQQQPMTLPDFLETTTESVNINDIQGNPWQPQVNYRGFGASPLLGEPAGISVYLDGVRVNEPFGDVVNWDLIPLGALAAINVTPGSNPLYGLNTLGGALALRTKSGREFPNTMAQAYYGSWNRWAVSAEHGGYNDKGLDYYGYFNVARDSGWRDYSPSDVNQFFGKVGWQSSTTDIDLTLALANNDLVGNGLSPQSFLDSRWKSIFTHPDQTQNMLWAVNLTAGHWLADDKLVSGNAYYRRTKRDTLNGDINDDFEGDPALDGAEGANGGLGFNSQTGANNRTYTTQSAWGGSLLFTLVSSRNDFKVGATYDQTSSSFSQTTTLGVFDSTRAVFQEDPAETENSLDGSTRTWSLLATDTFRILPNLAATGSLRYNYSTVKATDQLNPNPPNLDANYTYSKLNPAAGLTWSPSSKLNVFGGWSQGNRVPTPIELGCADPANPCTLPAGLASDPYLNQVVARTWEFGARGLLTQEIGWNAALFQTRNTNDILFVGTSTSAGYFTNYGETQRRGFELGVRGGHPRFRWFFNYSYIDATFQSDACLLSENNSSRGTSTACTDVSAGTGDDLIYVTKGNRIPGIPLHQARFFAEYQILNNWWFGGSVVAFSDQHVRGNENNQHQAGTSTDLLGDTRTFLGPGTAPGYFVVNLSTRFRPHLRWEIFARINNLFNRKYYSAGALAENPFASGAFQTNSDDWTRETFYAPGTPVWGVVGVRFVLDRPAKR